MENVKSEIASLVNQNEYSGQDKNDNNDNEEIETKSDIVDALTPKTVDEVVSDKIEATSQNIKETVISENNAKNIDDVLEGVEDKINEVPTNLNPGEILNATVASLATLDREDGASEVEATLSENGETIKKDDDEDVEGDLKSAFGDKNDSENESIKSGENGSDQGENDKASISDAEKESDDEDNKSNNDDASSNQMISQSPGVSKADSEKESPAESSSSTPKAEEVSRAASSLLRPDSAKSTRSRPASARTISRRASIEVLSDAGTPRINAIEEDNDGNDEKNEEETKSDSGAGESDASTIGRDDDKDNDDDVEDDDDGGGDDDDDKTKEIITAVAAAAAPTIAAGGTVFATAARKKSKSKYFYICSQDYPFCLGVPAHLKNVRSVIAKTFHENERYNSSKRTIYIKEGLFCMPISR